MKRWCLVAGGGYLRFRASRYQIIDQLPEGEHRVLWKLAAAAGEVNAGESVLYQSLSVSRRSRAESDF
jgi:hypothetical protein